MADRGNGPERAIVVVARSGTAGAPGDYVAPLVKHTPAAISSRREREVCLAIRGERK